MVSGRYRHSVGTVPTWCRCERGGRFRIFTLINGVIPSEKTQDDPVLGTGRTDALLDDLDNASSHQGAPGALNLPDAVAEIFCNRGRAAPPRHLAVALEAQ
jgi:hypothetical protein